jgi:hypothetical protein
VIARVDALEPKRLVAAYLERDRATKRAALSRVASALRAAGGNAVSGVAIEGAVVAADERYVAVSHPLNGRSFYFDRERGEALALAEHTLRHDRPLRAGPYFVTEHGALYQPETNSYAPLGDARAFAAHPDGEHVFVLAGDCRVESWSPAPLGRERRLAAHAISDALDPPCQVSSFADAAVGDRGAVLVTRFGTWTLHDGRWHAPPPAWDSRPPNVALAVSRDGRYLARIRREGSDVLGDRLSLLVRGTARIVEATGRVGPIVNTDALDFYDNPPRLCVVNYGVEAFGAPSLTVLELPPQGTIDLTACATKMSPSPAGDPELDAWLERNLCTLDGYMLPREDCFDP